MSWFFLTGIFLGGALGGLGAGAALYRLQRTREKRALQALVTHVHLKRALAQDGPGVIEPDHDAARCRSAVADVRQQIRETLGELRPGSASPAAVLLEMHRACDAYLRETNGRNYEARLRVLRPVLNEGARRLSGGRHVQYLAPGQREAVRRETVGRETVGREAAGSGMAGHGDGARHPAPVRHKRVRRVLQRVS